MNKKEKLAKLLEEVIYIDPPTKVKDILLRPIECLQIGRRCVGVKTIWREHERIEIPKYKIARHRIKFSDGLVLNIDKAVFDSVKKGKKIEHFNFWE